MNDWTKLFQAVLSCRDAEQEPMVEPPPMETVHVVRSDPPCRGRHHHKTFFAGFTGFGFSPVSGFTGFDPQDFIIGFRFYWFRFLASFRGTNPYPPV